MECMARNSCRLFATNKEMQRHTRNDHYLTCQSTDHFQESVTTPRNPPYQCPLTGCNKTYKTVGWWTGHMRSVHPQCTIVDEGSAAPIDVTESERSTTKQFSPAQVVVVPKDMESSETDSREIFSCPSAQRLILSRSPQNHCARVHGWPYTRNQATRGRDWRLSSLKTHLQPCRRPPASTGSKVGV